MGFPQFPGQPFSEIGLDTILGFVCKVLGVQEGFAAGRLKAVESEVDAVWTECLHETEMQETSLFSSSISILQKLFHV